MAEDNFKMEEQISHHHNSLAFSLPFQNTTSLLRRFCLPILWLNKIFIIVALKTCQLRKGVFKVGTKVEGNYRGLGNWCPSTIGEVNGDGMYMVLFDDGNCEENIPARMIRLGVEEKVWSCP